MLRPDSQPLTCFEAGQLASKQVSVSSFKAGQFKLPCCVDRVGVQARATVIGTTLL